MNEILISVVVPTYNRIAYLKNCLNSLVTQSFDNKHFEIIIVNDGSHDSTEEYVSSFQKASECSIKLLSHENRGVSYSRNVGIKNAEGKYVAFTDDDCILPSTWLQQMFDFFNKSDEKLGGIGGPLESVNILYEESVITRYLEFLDDFNYISILGNIIIKPLHISEITDDMIVPYLRTSNAMFRKDCLLKVEGFDEYFVRPGGEDPDICYRILDLGYYFKVDSSIVIQHDSRDSFKSFFKSIKNYSIGDLRKSKKKSGYKNSIVRNTYSFLPLQRFVSSCLCILTVPKFIIEVIKDDRTKNVDVFSFPIIKVLAKLYALMLVIYYSFFKNVD